MAQRTRQHAWLLGVLLTVCCVSLTGCASAEPARGISELNNQYNQGQYAQAYTLGTRLSRSNIALQRDSAAYIAGLSAQKLGRTSEAQRYLRQAATSRDQALAGDALASLGLLHAEMGRHEYAARELLAAAERLNGQDKANAYLYAGISQQKLGQWAQAKTSLVLARSASTNNAFTARVAEQLQVNGYALQLGAFSETTNAQRAAQQVANQTAQLRLGAPRLVATTDRSGKALTAVQVGRFATFAAALQGRNRLGNSSAIIVPLAER
jgi:hypothetical protein